MNKVFIDTGPFIALFADKDQYHKKAVDAFNVYNQERSSFFTSYYILDELFTRLLYDFGQHVARKEIERLNLAIAREELRVLDIDEVIFKKAIEVFLKLSEHKISFTDATTVVLYKDFALDEVFTLDSDFKKMRIRTSL